LSGRVARSIAVLIRTALGRFGYVLWKREFLQYGISPFLDIARLSRATVRPVRTFFDVGAHVGGTARQALETFPEARVYAFEPHPETFARLRRGLSHERLSIHELALGDSSGQVTFYEYGTDGGGAQLNSLVPDARFPRQFGYRPTERTAACMTVDDFCDANGIGRIDVLKVDAEGYDLAVIKGAARMLAEGRIGFIYAEFNDLLPKPGTTGGGLLPMGEYLAPFGFRYVATYTDFILPGAEMFVSANVLFAQTVPVVAP
jgi:FkbM family methyltransferase